MFIKLEPFGTLIGLLCLGVAQDIADGCQYSYDIQPGPVTKSFSQQADPGTGSPVLILCCQVSSELRTDFSIQWHYSISQLPSSKRRDVEDTIIDQANKQYSIDAKRATLAGRTRVWSQLRVNEFDHKGEENGYFWCSVNSSGLTTETANPSTVLNISSTENLQLQTCSCGDGPTNTSTGVSVLRCADDDGININVIGAHDNACPQTYTKGVSQLTSTMQTTVSPEVIQEPQDGRATTTSIGIVIGASAVGLIVVLTLTVGLFSLVVSKIKIKRQKQKHTIEISPPFDVYNLTTKTKLDNSSAFTCESNVSYERTNVSAGVTTSPSLEHVYDYVYFVP